MFLDVRQIIQNAFLSKNYQCLTRKEFKSVSRFESEFSLDAQILYTVHNLTLNQSFSSFIVTRQPLGFEEGPLEICHLQVLRTDASGMPIEWLGYQEAAKLYYLEAIAYTCGTALYTLHGGINAKTGHPSLIEVNSSSPPITIRKRAKPQIPAICRRSAMPHYSAGMTTSACTADSVSAKSTSPATTSGPSAKAAVMSGATW